MIMFADQNDYYMKKYYCIAALATLAIICLQMNYVFNLYNSYITEKTLELHQALKTAIDEELRDRNLTRIGKEKKDEWVLKRIPKSEMSPEELTKIQPLDSINVDAAREAGIGGTSAEIIMQLMQNRALAAGYPLHIPTLAQHFSQQPQTAGLPYALYLLDKDKNVIASADSLQGRRADYVSRPLSIGTQGLQYLRLEAAIPPSDFILQNVDILAASLLLMLTVLLCVALQLGKIRRQANVLQRREDTINGTIHDLKSPLNSVIATLSWIAMGEGSEAKRKALDISRAEVKHLVCNIESLLVTVRKDRHRLILKKEAIDLPRLAEIVKSSLDTLYQAKPHSLQIVNRLPSGIRICADGMYIESVLRNLAENALKYADDGVQVQVTLSATEREAQVDVQDNGWGIAPRYQRKLFRQFYQVPRDEAHARKGYGIGLAQAKYIIDEHKGRISVQSAEGKGSTFSFRIPLA